MVTTNSKSYFREVEKSHRNYTAALKRAGSRQSVMNLYWRHKRQHEALLKKHLREEMAEIVQIKKKFK
ncbi:MAG: hypothetical protein WCC52_00965 [Nitrosotalea sp.]|uniref:hypothetical protein n=1 Tax=Candidatus Nitrosotalea sp. TS TaxID=2341020 RepID=UPI00140E8A60|nr:hypothetical protein [Candidatus Nitrosotalea sp. TS]MDE1826274.1 hypothetical protein [Nitrososphaerota archaeon]MDE1871857.1 hypothetical protein [Nitrososphaerota archaeon]NHI03830.1 hypothetical protein [Candidatus Nitrosotalea sp. TS]